MAHIRRLFGLSCASSILSLWGNRTNITVRCIYITVPWSSAFYTFFYQMVFGHFFYDANSTLYGRIDVLRALNVNQHFIGPLSSSDHKNWTSIARTPIRTGESTSLTHTRSFWQNQTKAFNALSERTYNASWSITIHAYHRHKLCFRLWLWTYISFMDASDFIPEILNPLWQWI